MNKAELTNKLCLKPPQIPCVAVRVRCMLETCRNEWTSTDVELGYLCVVSC